MAHKQHAPETPATAFHRQHGVRFTEHLYDYVEHGGTGESSRQLHVDEHHVVKTLVKQDQDAHPLIVLMHGDRKVSLKNLARQIGAKSVTPCKPEVAQRHSGYPVGGTSPFGTRKSLPVYVQCSILVLPTIYINGGYRGFLVGITPQVLADVLHATACDCALVCVIRRVSQTECFFRGVPHPALQRRACFDTLASVSLQLLPILRIPRSGL